MGHYASEMGYTSRIEDWELWGFKRISFTNYDHIIECPLCHAAVVKGYFDSKKDSGWWSHIQWHVGNDEHWDWQPPANS